MANKVLLICAICEKQLYIWPYEAKGNSKKKPRTTCSHSCSAKLRMKTNDNYVHNTQVYKKISKSLTGKKLSPERIKKMSFLGLGRKLSLESRKKLSESIKGHPAYFRAYGKNNPFWKGDKVGYSGLHGWVKIHLGKAFWCTWCFSTVNIQWANVSHEYKRDLNDWMQLCAKCHKQFDSKEYKGTAKNYFLLYRNGRLGGRLKADTDIQKSLTKR